jgi:hypothetical protein
MKEFDIVCPAFESVAAAFETPTQYDGEHVAIDDDVPTYWLAALSLQSNKK